MIEAHGLTRRYGATLAVDGLSFELRPGAVTGFLGPNGSRRDRRHPGRLRGVVEKHVASIFAKLCLPPSGSDNRRVLAVLRYLEP